MNSPQQQAAGALRKIVNVHLDENSDWVAELQCGHQQHVRHNPPWTTRAWVMTPEGRAEHIGRTLLCLLCTTADSKERELPGTSI